MLSPARLAAVIAVAAKLAISNPGSMPPKNCIRLKTGKPVRMKSARLPTRDTSLPKMISRFSKSVASRNSSVFFSFSSAIAPAT